MDYFVGPLYIKWKGAMNLGFSKIMVVYKKKNVYNYAWNLKNKTHVSINRHIKREKMLRQK